MLILQTYAPEVLATVADRLPADTPVDVLFHLGLDDQRIIPLTARDLTGFSDADHLTSLYVEGLRTAGEAMDALVSFTRRLRAECPWDQEQTHASLARYLVEESYETLDALSNLAAMIEAGEEDATLVAHAEEELGDLLFQVLFHAELGDEEGRFNLATIADAERDKLTGRHPHVFGDVVVKNADEVAANWEVIKNVEKGRASVLDGIAWQLPSLALQAKVLQRSRSLDVEAPATLEDVVTLLLSHLARPQGATRDEEAVAEGLRAVLWALSSHAASVGIDLESLLREDILRRRDQILAIEANQ